MREKGGTQNLKRPIGSVGRPTAFKKRAVECITRCLALQPNLLAVFRKSGGEAKIKTLIKKVFRYYWFVNAVSRGW